jgi:hypothetical protein
MVLEVVAEDRVAWFEYCLFSPRDISFWEAGNIDMVCSHISGDIVEFAEVMGGIEAVWVLQYEAHGVGRFGLGKGIAPKLGVEVSGCDGALGWGGGRGCCRTRHGCNSGYKYSEEQEE